MRQRNRRGLTLTEAVIGGFIAVMLGVFMVKLLGSGLSAHSKASQTHDAESGVRAVMSLLTAELRSAAVPPLSDPLVASPVFWPGVWGATQEVTADDPFYPREEEDVDTDLKLDSSTNRLLYVRASEDEPQASDGPLDAFALVELVVPEERPNTLERRIHPLTSLTGGILKREKVKGANGGELDGWVVDMDALAADTSAPTEVLYDAGPDARVAFRVSHRTFKPLSDPGRTRYPQPFDPGVFKIEVAVAVKAGGADAAQKAWPLDTDWSTVREEATELRIPSVRQN